MKQKRSWKITDELWEAARSLIPKLERDSEKTYRRKPGGGRPPMDPRRVLWAIFCAQAPCGKPCPSVDSGDQSELA